jgi:hypothetical protein
MNRTDSPPMSTASKDHLWLLTSSGDVKRMKPHHPSNKPMPTTTPEVIFAIPAGLSPQEHDRLTGLANACVGRFSKSGHWHFTPVRGEKFCLLWRTGWRHSGAWVSAEYKKDRRTYAHFRCPGVHVQADAIRLARVMDAPKEAVA